VIRQLVNIILVYGRQREDNPRMMCARDTAAIRNLALSRGQAMARRRGARFDSVVYYGVFKRIEKAD
jgi:hypothetical protein